MNTIEFKNLQEQFSSLTRRPSEDCWAFNIEPSQYLSLCKTLKEQYGYDMLMDLTAIDWHLETPRFTVVVHLLSTEHADYIRIACHCLSDTDPSLPTLSHLYPAANWHERETYDLMGLRFTGHPNLKRILLWDAYPHHPLRKEFPLAGIQTDLPAPDVVAQTQASVQPAPMMGGPFHATSSSILSQSEPRGADETWTESHIKPSEPCLK